MRVRATTFALLLTALVLSCGPGPQPGEEGGPKVRAEAYLFDAELRRDGKWNSFRLEIFHSDSVMSLAGRGFLGKTGIKGRVTHDSLLVFFPTEDEYVQEFIPDLLYSLECGIEPTGMNFLDLFRMLPDSATLDTNIAVTLNEVDEKHPSYLVFIQHCPWQIELTYDHESDAGWRVSQFSFYDGKRTHLKATRREFKKNINLWPSRLQVRVPSDAERIAP